MDGKRDRRLHRFGGVGGCREVIVQSPTGISSNGVPLTLWHGTIHESDSFNVTSIAFEGPTPSGWAIFNSATTMKVQFRADVHPWRGSVNAVPLPPTLWFMNVLPSSSGTVDEIQGSFTGKASSTTFTLTLAPPPTLPIPLYPTTTGRKGVSTFVFGSQAALGTSQAGCSAASNDGSGLPLCLGVAEIASNAATCMDSPKDTLCGPNGYGSQLTFDYNTMGYTLDVNQLTMQVNPKNYTVSMSPLSYSDSMNSNDWPSNWTGTGTTKYTFSFQAPISPPDAFTPALTHP